MDGISEEQLRQHALAQLKKKNDLRTNLLAYVLVNLMLVGFWAFTWRGFFWPIFPILGWGVGLAFHAWDVYVQKPPSDADIRREMERMRPKTPSHV